MTTYTRWRVTKPRFKRGIHRRYFCPWCRRALRCHEGRLCQLCDGRI